MPTVLTPFMFAYIIWYNKDGKELKSMIQAGKVDHMVGEMRKLGVEPKVIMAQPLH